MSADNVSAVRIAYDAMSQGDPDVFGMFAEQMEFHEPESLPWGGIYHGPDGMGKLFAALAEHWDDLRLEVERGCSTRATTSSLGGACKAARERPGGTWASLTWRF